MEQIAIDLPPRAVGARMGELCTDKAERVTDFSGAAAGEFIVGYLRTHGATSGEQLVRKAMAQGHVPHDMRAFGSVFGSLVRKNLIRCLRSDLPRERGHGTSGGKLWSAVR